MFEKAIICRVGTDKHADLGLLAETMFFYGQTQLLLDQASVISLSKLLSAEVLKALLDSQWLRIAYTRENFGVMSDGMPASHDFGAFNLYQTEKGRKLRDHREEIEEVLIRVPGNSGATKRLTKVVADRADLHRFRGVPEKSKIISDLARKDVGIQYF